MKSILAILFSAILFFSLGSCTKELSYEIPVLDSAAGSGNFYATINGQLWEADSLESASFDDGFLTLAGVNHAGNAMAIAIVSAQVGSFTLSDQTPSYAAYGNFTDTNNVYATNLNPNPSQSAGTVVITSIDTVKRTVSGTFQFNVYAYSNGKALTVTAGVFNNISYNGLVINPGGPSSPGNGSGTGLKDTLEAKVNSVAWTAAQIESGVQMNDLAIAGISVDGKQSVDLYMTADVTPGSYQMDFSRGTTFAAYIPDVTIASPVLFLPLNGIGKINIIDNDKVNRRIRGNFTFTGQTPDLSQSAEVTDGYFSVSY